MKFGCRLPSPACATVGIDDAVLALDARDLVEHRGQGAARHRDVLDERRAERLHRGMHRPADRRAAARPRRGRARRRPCRPRRARTAAIASASTAAAGPSVWIVSCAAPGVGGSSDSSAWTAARDAASISSMIAGCTPEAVTAADASAAVRTSGKVAAIVQTSPGTSRRSFSVAPTTTPSVPSEPMTSDVRSRPVTPFTRAVAEVQQPAVGEHEIDAEDGIAHDAVLRAQQSARAGGDVAADGRDRAARRIRRPPQAVRGERGVEVGVEDARLDDGEQVVGAHLEDAVHRPQRQRDLAARRRSRRPRDRSRRRAARPACAVSVAMRRVACTSATDARVDDGEREPGCRVPRLVGARGCERGRRRVDAVAERGAQARDDVGRGSLTRSGAVRR